MMLPMILLNLVLVILGLVGILGERTALWWAFGLDGAVLIWMFFFVLPMLADGK